MKNILTNLKIGIQAVFLYIGAVLTSMLVVVLVATLAFLLMPFAAATPAIQHFIERKKKHQ